MLKELVDLQPLHDLVWRFRDLLSGVWSLPPQNHCYAFALTEFAGESLDAYLRTFPQYARNNLRDHDEREEIADGLMMLVSAVGRTAGKFLPEEDIDRVSIISEATWCYKSVEREGVSRFLTHYTLRLEADVVQYLGGLEEAMRLVEGRLQRIEKKHAKT